MKSSLIILLFLSSANLLAMYPQNTGFFKHSSGIFPDLVPDVGMDCYSTVLGANPVIGTSGVSTCIVVCGKGWSKTLGSNVISLGHTSSLVPPSCALPKITRELIEMGCTYPNIQLYIIGGTPEIYSIEAFIKLARCFNVVDYLFNPFNLQKGAYGPDSEDSDFSETDPPGMTIVLTKDNIFYGRDGELVFSSLKGGEYCGNDDWNDNEAIPPPFGRAVSNVFLLFRKSCHFATLRIKSRTI